MESLFFQAVMEGNEGEVARLLDDDPALLEKEGHAGVTPFLLAARHGQLGVVQLLIQRGADANVTTSLLSNTALHLAAWGGHEQTAAFLLGQGAQSTHRGKDGRTPLMLACEMRHLGVVRLLAQHVGKQELEATDEEGQTALHVAALYGYDEVVSFLLGQGAMPSSRDGSNATPLMLACEEGCVGAARLLLQHAGGAQALLEVDERGWTALHYAAEYSHEETATFLLGQGAQANSKAEDGTTPFMLACGSGQICVVKVLLQHMGGGLSSLGARALQDTDERGWTALHVAAYWGHEEIVNFLLGQGAQANSQDEHGRTPLMWACRQGRLGVLRLLLQHIGPEALQMGDRNGMVALHWACAEGYGAVVRALLLSGADPTITDIEGRTPRAIAEMEEEEEDENEHEEEEEEEKRSRAGCVAAFEVRKLHVVAHTSLVWPAYIPSR
jgi:ankyrin repeat protein